MKNSELQDLFVEYYPALKSFAVRYVGAAEVAEDLVQDVFLRLWEKTNPLQGVRDVSAYLYQMVRFRAIDYLRSEKTKEQTVRKYIAGLAAADVEHRGLDAEAVQRIYQNISVFLHLAGGTSLIVGAGRVEKVQRGVAVRLGRLRLHCGQVHGVGVSFGGRRR